eukprot:Skav235508  [mRNA]  locus=scaffold625:506698:513465:- [translate_table: standard]
MVRLGFPCQVVRAWFSALGSLTRRVLLGGYCFGSSQSHTGVPEGDPISVVAMFVMSLLFGYHVVTHSPRLLPSCYADNWQVVAASSTQLKDLVPVLQDFLSKACLPVAPAKCWVWSITKLGRKRLRNFHLFEQPVPLQLQARELGADISYCFRRAAKVRNSRVITGVRRFHRLAGVPATRPRKTRILLSGIFPHVLHGAETCSVPRTVLQRLRSYTALYKGPTQLLVGTLADLGWDHLGHGTFVDEYGRSFHLVLTSLAHIESLLLSSWSEKVCSQVSHRKYLDDLHTIDVSATLCVSHLLPSERALLIPQRTGAFFSGEHVKHFAPEASHCPLCGQVDGRLHRTDTCPRALVLRAAYPALETVWDTLPEHTRAYGIWSELPSFRPWQAELDSRTPVIPPRSLDPDQVVLYTDGSCLHPKSPQCRIASFAVVQALPGGQLGTIRSGLLPGSHQTPYRAELYAVVLAFAAHSRPLVFSDCLGVVRRCRKLLQAKQQDAPLKLPSSNTDLWTMFCQQLDQVDLAYADIQWIPGHQTWQDCAGSARVHAWFNQWADRIAKQALQDHRTQLYLAHLQAWQTRQPLISQLARFHAALAQMFVAEKVEPPPRAVIHVASIQQIGPPRYCVLPAVYPPSCHARFTQHLASWLSTRAWTPSAAGDWVTVDDDPVHLFVLPSAHSLLRSFLKFLDGLLKVATVHQATGFGYESPAGASEGFRVGKLWPAMALPRPSISVETEHLKACNSVSVCAARVEECADLSPATTAWLMKEVLKERSRKEGKKERRKEGKKERRKEGKKKRRKEGKKERRKEKKERQQQQQQQQQRNFNDTVDSNHDLNKLKVEGNPVMTSNRVQ